MTDLGDGMRGELQTLADYAALLLRERDEAIARADGYVDLIHAAIRHHLDCHPDCHSWETR